MTREAQKNTELKHLEFFESLLPEFPEGEVKPRDNPDFQVVATEGVIGIEHSLVHKKQQDNSENKSKEILPQAYESAQNKVVSMARKIAEEKNLPSTWVEIFFEEETKPNNEGCKKLAQDIAKVIEENIRSKKCIQLDKSFDINEEYLPEGVWFIKFHFRGDGEVNFWCAGHNAGWVMASAIESIQKGIDRKAEKYSKYIENLENCSECWLLLVAGSNVSSFINPDQRSLDHVYCSPFDKTFFMDFLGSKFHKLKTRWS